MVVKTIITSAVLVAAVSIASFWVVHDLLIHKSNVELLDKQHIIAEKQAQIDVLMLYSLTLTDKVNTYEVYLNELAKNGCIMPHSKPDKKEETPL